MCSLIKYFEILLTQLLLYSLWNVMPVTDSADIVGQWGLWHVMPVTDNADIVGRWGLWNVMPVTDSADIAGRWSLWNVMPVTDSADIVGRWGTPAVIGWDSVQHATAGRSAAGPGVPCDVASGVLRRDPADGSLSRQTAERISDAMDLPRRSHLRLCSFRGSPCDTQVLDADYSVGLGRTCSFQPVSHYISAGT